jgi:hypothetical protein
VEITKQDAQEGLSRCPDCGNAVRLRISSTSSRTPDSDETLMVNVRDMAKIAQSGVESSYSGEWNTSEPDRGE